MSRIDCVVIGAGVVGLAVAAELARRGLEVGVLEAEPSFGTGISSRNSEVIHAGIYYPRGSLKAQCCVEGRERLYRYARARGIGHRRCGKLIVATTDTQRSELESIDQRARANGVDDLVLLERKQALAMEPALDCVAALLSPSTGIVDSHALMLSLLADLEAAGGFIAFRSPVRSIRRGREGGLELRTGGAEPAMLEAARVVNSAGLGAIALASRIEGFPAHALPVQHLAKGNYFALSGARAPFTRLVYPVPETTAGLGVHLTLDLAGQARFGPDVEWIDALDYRVDPRRAEDFHAAIRSYWPGLPAGSLVPAYAGIRPKLQGPGQPAADFVIQPAAIHGIAGLVNLFGIESPGLTSSLSLARRVADLLET